MKECLNYINNCFLNLFSKHPDPKRYDGLVISVKMKNEEKYGYMYVHHAYHNFFRREPLSFIGLVVYEGQDEKAYEQVSELSLDIIKASDFELYFIKRSEWLKHNLAYNACCKLKNVKSKSHYHLKEVN